MIAEACQVPGVPWTRWGMTKHFKRLAAVDPDESAAMSRTRAGQKGGGGTEFYWSYFPEALWDVLDAEVGQREQAARETCAPDVGALTPHDEQLMQNMARDDYGHINHFERPAPRRVRRSRVVVGATQYWNPSLHKFDGQEVLIVRPLLSDPRPAFIWKCDPETKCLAAHGQDGFIGMAEAELEPDGIHSVDELMRIAEKE